MNVARIGLLAPMIAVVCLVAAPASATWQMYVSGDFGYSIAKSKVSGSADAVNLGDPFSGRDKDVSPVVSGAIGVEIPMFELTPWRMPWDIRLPDWPVRFEFEATGARDYELTTSGLFPGPASDPFNTDIKAWTFMQNVWLDVPLRGLYRPISATSGFLFREPRLPWLRRFLQPATAYAGLGIGFAHLDVDSAEPSFEGSKKKYDFAYQFGTGLGYQLTDYVNLGVGYRYVKPAKLKMDLRDDAGRPGKSRITNDIHEIRFVLRIRVFDLPYPWR
jgi:opacity protein-like surface antigen